MTCQVDGCEKTARSRGWCSAHYMRWVRHGDPLAMKRLRVEPAECGTYAGYQAHLGKHEQSCEACRAANRDQMRRYRSANPQSRERERERNKARSRALWRLADLYPAEFERLYLDELGPPKQLSGADPNGSDDGGAS